MHFVRIIACLSSLIAFVFLSAQSNANPLRRFLKKPRSEMLNERFARSLELQISVSEPVLNEERAPTNWVELGISSNLNYWIEWEQKFLQFSPKQRGFDRSLLEKYVFLQQIVSVPDMELAQGGPILAMEARSGRKTRFVVWMSREGPAFHLQVFSE